MKTKFIGKVGDYNYAMDIPGVPADYPRMPFGRMLDYKGKLSDLYKEAKVYYVDSKGKATLSSVKRWVKDNKPAAYFTKWKCDSSSYKDDSVAIRAILDHAEVR